MMNKLLENKNNQIRSVNENPTTVSQTGDSNVYINNAGKIEQTNILYPTVTKINSNKQYPIPQIINTKYYNLIVIAGCEFDDTLSIEPDRAIRIGYTDDFIRNELGQLTKNDIDKIQTYPTLFLPETEQQNGLAGKSQIGFIGFIHKIIVSRDTIKIKANYLWSFPLSAITKLGNHLDLLCMDRAITELNHTHWAIKEANLIGVLAGAGIHLMGPQQNEGE